MTKRFVLVTVAVLSLTVPIVTGAIEAAAFAAGQLSNPLIGSAIDPESRFEVVSIKRSDPSAQLRLGMIPGRIDLVGAPVRMVAAMVLPIRRVFGWPDGIDTERYTISAKMPDGAPLAAQQVAIRNLLKDRFNLVTHQETREVPIYNLVLARSDRTLGPRIKPATVDCTPFLTGKRPMQESPRDPGNRFGLCSVGGAFTPAGLLTPRLNGRPLTGLIQHLEEAMELRVIDRTGLKGNYDIELSYLDESLADPSLPAAQALRGPSLFAALQEQLGMKLEAGRGPVEVLVVDSASAPTPN
jgi:uncharacterized protein (TIGR03435 family)